MTLRITAMVERWPVAGQFIISRGTKTYVNVLVVAAGDGSADTTKEFYNEYRSIRDMTAKFYLPTVYVVFQRQLLPKGD